MHETNLSATRPQDSGSGKQELLAECLTGDHEQVGELVNLYRPYLLAIAQGEWRDGLRAKEGVSDLVQETIIKGAEAFGDFRGSTEGEFAAWLRQILIRRIQNAVRKYRTEGRETGREEALAEQQAAARDATASAALVSLETRELLLAALSRLSPDAMEVVRLRQFENLTWEEIAVRLNRSAEAARKLWARAVLQLQENLKLRTDVDAVFERTPEFAD